MEGLAHFTQETQSITCPQTFDETTNVPNAGRTACGKNSHIIKDGTTQVPNSGRTDCGKI